MTKTYYVGLDVHKETIAIAYAVGGTRDEPVYHGPCGDSVLAAERALRKLAEKLGVEFSALKVCYEAGPTGFVLIHLGLASILMSPSKTERKPNEKIKTDKRDACKIARRYVRWLEHRFAKGGEVRSLPERLRDAADRAAGLAGAWLPEALLRKHLHGGQKWPRQ